MKKAIVTREVGYEEAKKILAAMPDIQKVRGEVWTDGKREALASSIKHGYYIQPIVVGKNGKCWDGQQRLGGLVYAVEHGLVDADATLTAVIVDEDEECFVRQNSGVTVGAAITMASEADDIHRDAILHTASEYMPLVTHLTAAAVAKGAAATLASITYALAISNTQEDKDRWMPESGASSVYTYINRFETAGDAAAAAVAAAKAITSAILSAAEAMDKPAKRRKFIRFCAKTNTFTAMAARVVAGDSPADVVPILLSKCDGEDAIPDVTVKGVKASWGEGSKSSGNSTATASRIAALGAAVKVRKGAAREAAKAAKAAAKAAKAADRRGAKAAAAKAEAAAAKVNAAAKAAAAV